MLYFVSAVVGLAVGVAYGLLGVRSPAPPIVALLGLLGMLAGEQLVPIGRRLLMGEAVTLPTILADCRAHMLGHMPGPRPRPPEGQA